MRRDRKFSHRRLLLRILLPVALVVLGAPSLTRADTLDDAARQLARKVTAAFPPGEAVVVKLRNISSLASGEVAAVRRALEAELKGRGLRLVAESEPHVEIRVTLSENLEGYLWVAELARGEGSAVAMVAVPRSPAFAPSSVPPAVVIRKQFLWEQEEPILDLVLAERSGGAWGRMYVLEPSAVDVYKSQGQRWVRSQSLPLPKPRVALRDLWGRLTVEADKMVAALPGIHCNIAARSTPRVECQEIKFQWPPAAGEVVVEHGKKTPPWHSQATLESEGRRVQVIAGMDGRARLYEDGPEPIATFTGWGSELASLRSGCGSGWQLLVTRASDWTEPDVVIAYEISERQAVALSSPLDLPGPVMVLRSAGDVESAIAVARNLRTGRYEAYSLSISCSR